MPVRRRQAVLEEALVGADSIRGVRDASLKRSSPAWKVIVSGRGTAREVFAENLRTPD
jgi:hypothetical protein